MERVARVQIVGADFSDVQGATVDGDVGAGNLVAGDTARMVNKHGDGATHHEVAGNSEIADIGAGDVGLQRAIDNNTSPDGSVTSESGVNWERSGRSRKTGSVQYARRNDNYCCAAGDVGICADRIGRQRQHTIANGSRAAVRLDTC